MHRPADQSPTAAEIAAALGAELRGAADVRVTGVAPLADAGRSDLSWLGSPKYLSQLATTRAAAILVPPGCEVPTGPATIVVNDPDLALVRVLEWFQPHIDDVPVGVHSTATIGEGAVADGAHIGPHVFIGPRAHVAAGTRVHPGVYIGSDARIGPDCTLWPNVVIRERCALGARVVVHANSSIGADGFSFLQRGGRNVKIPQIGTVIIEDDVEIGACVCIDRARTGATRIGRGSKIDNLVQIGHNVQVGEDCIVVAQTGISGSSVLEKNVTLAGQVGVADHVRIGAGTLALAKTGIQSDTSSGSVLRGNPAVERMQFLRQQAALKRLPDLIQEIRGLRRRIEELESPENNRQRS